MSIAKSCLEAAKVTCPQSLPDGSSAHCAFNLNIGIFFDGTDNNMQRDTPTRAQSNVARLFSAYKDDKNRGYFRHYIPGVGTPFEGLGTDGENFFEAAAGKGGEARIIWGLLEIFNSIHRFVNNNEAMFSIPEMRVLCSNYFYKPESQSEWPKPASSEINAILNKMNLRSGLEGNEATRKKFFLAQGHTLSPHLINKFPKIAGIYIDIFGFSRGAAQARVFTNWLLNEVFQDGKLFGVPSYVRILGLMDTVASVGSTNTTWGEGHWSWASAENLQIHPEVKNCVHYVALHELRTTFPCDSVMRNGVLPPNCHEHYYPGVHSDVGGGYAPGYQGKAWRVEEDDSGRKTVLADDSQKLSQLPLNDMYQAAQCASANHPYNPWLKIDTNSEEGFNPLAEQFALASQVRTSVETYLNHSKINASHPIDRQLREHSLLYLTWRYHIIKIGMFPQLDSTYCAGKLNKSSLKYYEEGQEVLKHQIAHMGDNVRFYDVVSWIDFFRLAPMRFGRHANEIYQRIKKKVTITQEIHDFFDHRVHDSYAGFIEKLESEANRRRIEGEGYLRYRAVYLGNDNRLNAMADMPKQKVA